MSRMLASRMGYEPERTLASTAIATTYAATGIIGAAFTHPLRIIVLQNDSDVAVSFSLDGVNTLVTLAAGKSLVLDVTSNRTDDPNGLTVPIRWGFYAQGPAAGTTGTIKCSAVYGAGAESWTL